MEGDLESIFPDTPTHIGLYKAFKDLGGIVHTHSPWATSWAGTGREKYSCYGTTHADCFYGEFHVQEASQRRKLKKPVRKNTGLVIIETF